MTGATDTNYRIDAAFSPGAGAVVANNARRYHREDNRSLENKVNDSSILGMGMFLLAVVFVITLLIKSRQP